MIHIITTALLNASASFLLKKANSYPEPLWYFGLSFIGLLLYGISFLFYAYILRMHDASWAYTFVTGLTIVFLSIASCVLLGENFSTGKIVGIGLVFLGLGCIVLYG